MTVHAQRREGPDDAALHRDRSRPQPEGPPLPGGRSPNRGRAPGTRPRGTDPAPQAGPSRRARLQVLPHRARGRPAQDRTHLGRGVRVEPVSGTRARPPSTRRSRDGPAYGAGAGPRPGAVRG
ncbi:hypothetical protein GCM10009527_044190 [Actinomadura nitritigenes]